jgi:glycosyltransferase involved in cell wall biosynthesis
VAGSLTGMHVLVAHSRYSADPSTGENVHVDREIAALGRAGVTVTRYLPTSAEQSSARLATRSLWSRAAAREIAQLVRDARPDIVHVHNIQPMLSPSVFAAATQAGVPVVATVHNYRFRCLPAINFRDGHVCHDCKPGRLFTPGIVHRCYRDSLAGSTVAAFGQLPARVTRRHVSRWLAISSHVADRLRADRFPAERVVVHHNFAPDPGPGRPPGSRTDEVLYAGKLTADKGIGLLLDAWRSAPEMPGRLLIAGRGALEADVRALAKEDARVTYLGAVSMEQLSAIRQRCSAAIVPSLWEEPFGLTAVEAMACATPVVTTGTGGLADVVDERSGWLVIPTPAGLADGIVAAVRDRGARGPAARDRYLAAFTEDTAMKRLLDIYRGVQSSHPGRA